MGYQITNFNNLHSHPAGEAALFPLSDSLVNESNLKPVEKVTRELKEHHTEAYTLCSFKSLDNAAKANLSLIFGLVLDFDDGILDFITIRDILVDQDIECLIHTTASHTSVSPRIRVVIPYATPLVADEDGKRLHEQAWKHFNDLIGPIDPAGKNPAQKWLRPKFIQQGEEFLHEELSGSYKFNPNDLAESDSGLTASDCRSAYTADCLAQSEPDQSKLPELDFLLEQIDPSCDYKTWFETIASAINAFGMNEGVLFSLETWSQRSEEKYDENSFSKAVESVRVDHENPAGLGKLYYLAGVPYKQPKQERLGIDQLEGIVPSDKHKLAADLTVRAHKHTIDLLNQFENVTDKAHSKGIWSICEGMAYSSLANKPIRVAYPLETGLGKTTAFRGFVRALWEAGEQISVAYCADRIDDLHDLYKGLIDDGIPGHLVGLLHTSPKHGHISSIPREAAGDYPILLLSHGRVQHQYSDPDNYIYYQGQKRNLVVWDEALRTARGEALDVDGIRADISAWKTVFQDKLSDGRSPRSSIDHYMYMQEYLSEVERLLADYILGSVFSIPPFDTNQCNYQSVLNSVLGKSRTGGLINLIESSGSEGKLVRAGSNKAYVQFDVIVPDELDKIVVLDASAEINLLNHYDPSVSIGNIGEIKKDYHKVTLYHAPVKSSRTYLATEFSKTPNLNLYLKELGHIVTNLIPCGAEFCVLTYKDRDNIQYQSQILKYLDSLGAGIKGRCNVITWGSERGTNRYSNIKYFITLGVQYRDPSEIAASIIAQRRDLKYQVTNAEIKQVSDSQQADILYQGLSRGHIRRTEQGVAGEMTCWVLHKEQGAVDRLVDEMPGVTVKSYIPEYLSEHGVSDAVEDLALRIVDYLKLIPRGIDKESLRSVAKAVGCTNTNSRKWRDAVQRACDLQHEWERPKGAQSFFRGEELKHYHQKNGTCTFVELTDKTLLQ